jgi:hypothetical protein
MDLTRGSKSGMIVRRKEGVYAVQLVNERQNSKVAITLQDQRFEVPSSIAEDIAAAIEEVIYARGT